MGTLRTATPPPSFLYTKIGGFARYFFLPKIHLEDLSKLIGVFSYLGKLGVYL